MQIQLKQIKVADLVKGYTNNNEEGVIGYDGKLNIRPKYQREFVYSQKQQESVINSIRNNYPLNVMYWVDNEDGTYEVLDGQQRSLSICQYVTGKFSLKFQYFHNLEPEEQEQILNYEILVYFCTGTNREKLNWFEIINIAGEKLTKQELRNAVYTGEWLTECKKYFSKTGCAAYNIGKDYVSGNPIRQDYLETVFDWISEGNVDNYMAKNQHNGNAEEVWKYFRDVIDWVKSKFQIYRKEMKGVDWGYLFNEYKSTYFSPSELEEEIKYLMSHEDVTNKKGIYSYILTKEEKHLNIRAFTDKQKREVYERQKGICTITGEKLSFEEMEGDHIIPFSKGGKTIIENLQMISKKANRTKSNK